MAIIKSMGVGKGRKSMGNVTYRTVRGRTIGSEKITPKTDPSTRGVGGSPRRAIFGMVSSYARMHASDIEVSFAKTKYGSQRNNFVKMNYPALRTALQSLANSASLNGDIPSDPQISAAITAYATANPESIVRVNLPGFDRVYLSGEWDPADNPVSGGATDALGSGSAFSQVGNKTFSAPIALSVSQRTGAIIIRDAGAVRLTSNVLPAGITAEDITYYSSSKTPIAAVTVTNVTSAAGELTYTTPAITAGMNASFIGVREMFIRLSSAYTVEENTGDFE